MFHSKHIFVFRKGSGDKGNFWDTLYNVSSPKTTNKMAHTRERQAASVSLIVCSWRLKSTSMKVKYRCAPGCQEEKGQEKITN